MNKKYAIIADPHGGLKRQAGTTPRSMSEYSLQQNSLLKGILASCEAQEVILLGDIFDRDIVDYETILYTAEALRCFPGKKYLVKGNHDQGGNQEKLTAFDLLGYMLTDDNTIMVKEPTRIDVGAWIVPHLHNQGAFDEAMERLAESNASVLLAHANYDNGFALEKDHSLNLSREQASRFDHVILGHEHAKRDLPGVDILGALFPCNIGECGVAKGFHYWDGPGHDVEFQPLWFPAEGYAELDWRELLEPVGAQASFVRIVGSANAEEAAQVVDEVARFRAASQAYFVSNSVKVGTIELGELEDFEDGKLAGFDALGALREMLPQKFHERMSKLLEEKA